MQLILASTSPARRALMESLGIPFHAEAPGVDEAVDEGLSVQEAVKSLALRKARAVQTRHPEAWIIGADQMVDLDGKALGKPKDREAARQQLASISGRSHQIITGLCVLGPKKCGIHKVRSDIATLTLWPLSDDEIERYLDTEEWKGCAGSYRVEGKGQLLFSNIEGDRTSIQGLPMLLLLRMLRNSGLRLL